MRLAIAKCRAHGIAAVGVRNSGHFGAAGTYTAMASDAGFVGIATSTTQEPAVVPTFGVEAMLGTNPIAMAAPAERNPPFMLDMATSTASLGKLVTAWRKGRTIPAGWAVDPSGATVTSGRRAAGYRRLTPLGATAELGSHKGYGLATAVAILSSVLPGAAPNGTSRVGHFFLVLDPARFRQGGTFAGDLDALLDGLHASRPIDATQPVLVAGDPEHAARRERLRSGVPLTRSLLEDLRTVARASGVRFTLDA
jgi:LDH2 family malate/lactate/ureidoglycolate dehydrogenase